MLNNNLRTLLKPSPKVCILYTEIPDNLPSVIYRQCLERLPLPLQINNSKYRQESDRLLNLYGNLLLIEALSLSGYDNTLLDKLDYNEYGRPFIGEAHSLDFNKSHSGRYVMCAVGKEVRIGIDIEQVKPIEFNDFSGVMTFDQWATINNSHNPLRSFYRYWAMKESVLKADSRGLSLSPRDIKIHRNTALCYGRRWHLFELMPDAQYCSFLAVNANNTSIQTKRISANELSSQFFY